MMYPEDAGFTSKAVIQRFLLLIKTLLEYFNVKRSKSAALMFVVCLRTPMAAKTTLNLHFVKAVFVFYEIY